MLDLTFMCCIYSSGTARIRGPLILEGPTNNLVLMCNSLIHIQLSPLTLVYIHLCLCGRLHLLDSISKKILMFFLSIFS